MSECHSYECEEDADKPGKYCQRCAVKASKLLSMIFQREETVEDKYITAGINPYKEPLGN